MFSKRFEMIGKIGGGIKIKNIFEINTTNQTVNGITKTFRDNGLYITGKTTSFSGFGIDNVELKANHTYFICNLVNDLNNKIYYRFVNNNYYGSQYHAYRFTQVSDTKTHFTFNITDTTFDCDFFVRPIVIDLTASKLDLLSVEELYNLLTLGGTDFANFERLANGETIKIDKLTLVEHLLKGTRYGIVDLGSLDYVYNSSVKAFWGYLKDFKSLGEYDKKDRLFCEKYRHEARLYAFGNLDADMLITSQTNAIFIRNLSFTNETDLKNSLKGQYLIYERDISYTHLDLLANGQTTLGLTSLLGKQNIKEALTGTKRDFVLGQNTDNTFYLAQGVNDSNKILSIVQGHKYFAIARVKNVISGYTNIRHWLWNLDTNTYSLVSATQDGDNYYGIINASFSGDRVVSTFAMNYASTISGTINPEYVVLIDLTASGLDNLTAQQVYDMLNVDLSTRYGNVDLGNVDWYVFQSGNFWCATTNYLYGKIKVYGGSEIPNIYVEGYTPNGYWYNVADKEVRIDTEGHDLYLWDNSFANKTGEEVKQMLAGKILKYELADQYAGELTAEELYYLLAGNYNNTPKLQVQNGMIIGTKYGVVDLGTLNWTAPIDNRTNTFSLTDILSNTSNVFCPKYTTTTIMGTTESGKIAVLNKNIYIADSNFNSKTSTEIKSLLNGVYLIYELDTPSGSNYDYLTAEQMYKLYFKEPFNSLGAYLEEDTTDSYKMKLAKGITIDATNGTLNNTEYKIIDLGDLNWYGLDSTTSRYYTYDLQNLIKIVGSNQIPNIYCPNYKSVIYTDAWITRKDLSICVGSDGFLGIVDTRYESNATLLKRALSGVYLVYELATPQGYKYQELYARNLYELINTNGISKLANGCRIGNYYSLLGKQNYLQLHPGYQTANDVWFMNGWYGVGTYSNAKGYNVTLVSNHKYLFYFSWNKQQDRVGQVWNAFEFWNNDAVIEGAYTYSHNGIYQKDCFFGFITPTATSKLTKIRYYINNGEPISEALDDYKDVILIDLTELGLENENATNLYNMLKNGDLSNLLEKGTIRKGGK